jgi:hypothetical protein
MGEAVIYFNSLSVIDLVGVLTLPFLDQDDGNHDNNTERSSSAEPVR